MLQEIAAKLARNESKKARPSKFLRRVYLVVFPLLIMACIGTEFFTVGIWLEAWNVGTWPTTKGRITRSEVVSSLEGPFESLGQFTADIEYTFDVDGKAYRSTSVRSRGETSSKAGDIRALVNRYQAGSVVNVYYEKENPSNSYLEAGPDLINYVIIVSPLVFGYLFAVGFMGLLRTSDESSA